MKTFVGCAGAFLGLTALGLWFYLLHGILSSIGASSAMWACYWVYVPLSLIGNVVMKVAEKLPDSWS